MTLDHTLPDDHCGDATSDSRRVGHFRLLRSIGKGGFGTVHEAWDLRLNRAVALKVLHRPGTEARTRLLAEARASAGLDQPAFVQVLEVFDDGEELALVMELVRGQTWSELLRAGPVPVIQALSMVQQVARAMAFAHNLGRVHGDLKPANLMVDQEGRARILDFGLATERQPATASRDPDAETLMEPGAHSGAGTLAYMAPELLLGAPANPGSDAYALGMILGELLTGQRPFAAFEGGLLAHAIVHGQQSAQADLTTFRPALRELIDALSTREPAERLVDMDTIARRIDVLLGERRRSHPAAPRTMSEPTSETDNQPESRTWWRYRWTIVVVLLIGVGVLRWPLQAINEHWQQQQLDAAESHLAEFEQRGRLDTAIAALEQFLQQRPDHAAAAADLAIAYCLRYAGDERDEAWLGRATASAQIAMAADDQLARSHSAMGWTTEFQGRRQEAIQHYERALVLDPADRYALIGLARAQMRLGALGEARRILDESRRRYPHDRMFVDSLGTWYFQQALYDDAERVFRESIAMAPDSVAAYANLNAVLLRQNRPEEALAVLQQGLRVRPDGQLYSNLGTVLYTLGRYNEAADAFQRSVSPSHGSPNDYLRWANLADALRQIPGRADDSLRAYTTTITLLTPILDRTPTDATLLSRAALYRAKLGQCPRSITAASTVRGQKPEQADVWFRLAQASELCALRDQAVADLVAARRLGFPLNLVQGEPDLIALRRDPLFQRAVLGHTLSPTQGTHNG